MAHLLLAGETKVERSDASAHLLLAGETMVFYFTADAKDPKDGEDYIVYMARLPASRARQIGATFGECRTSRGRTSSRTRA